MGRRSVLSFVRPLTVLLLKSLHDLDGVIRPLFFWECAVHFKEPEMHTHGLERFPIAPGRISLVLDGSCIGGTMFTLTPTGVNESVLAWTRAAVASPKELSDAGWREDTAMSMWQHHGASTAMAHFSRAITRENEGEVQYAIRYSEK